MQSERTRKTEPPLPGRESLPPEDATLLLGAALPKARNVFAQLEHPPVISIDGGAGSGKSSVANLVAERIGGVPVLDSGRWFRALGFLATRNGLAPTDKEQIEALAHRFAFSKAPMETPIEILARDLSASDTSPLGITSAELETPKVEEYASCIGKLHTVREIFKQRQLEEAREGCITVGRAQGSEVFTEGFSTRTGQPVVRILLHADLDARVRRRCLQQYERTPSASEFTHTKAALYKRDDRDMSRTVAPLLRPEEARTRGHTVIDTTNIPLDEVATKIIELIKKVAPNLSTNGSR